MSTPREKSEEISKGTREPENLDTENLSIWKAQLKNLLLTKEAFRDSRWKAKHDKTLKEIQRLSPKTTKAD